MRRTYWWLGSILSLALLSTLFQATAALAQTWTGASATTNNWSDGTNWSSTPTAPVNNGTALIVYNNSATVARTTSTVDVSYDVNTLTFQSGALGYVIDNSGGSTLTIEGGITDSSTTTETISAPVILGTTNSTTQTWTVDGTQLNVNGPITAGAGFAGFTKAGSGILQLGSSANSFGPINVAAGTLQQSAAGALPDVNYTITGGTLNFNNFNGTVGTVNLSSGTVELATTTGATNTVTMGAMTQSGSSTFNLNGGTANLPSYAQTGGTFSTGTGGTITITGALTQNGSSGNAQFSVDGGTATVGSLTGTDSTSSLNVGTTGVFNDQTTSATDTYAGILEGAGGTFNLNGAGGANLTLTNTNNATAFTSGNVNIATNNTLTGGASDAGSLPTANYTVNGTLNANGDSFSATGLSGAGAITLGAGTMTLKETTGGPFTYSGTIAGTTGSSIVTDTTNTQTQTLSGVISGATSIAANGGVLTLTGNNTYTGGTTLNAGGTVAIQEDDSTIANLGASSSALTFNGGTLQINGTIPTGFNPARSVTFTANGGGIDAQAAGEVFTVTQNITGGGPLNINPNGGLGTVVLTGAANSYGATNITSGTLQIGNGTTSGSLGTGAITDNGSLVINPATGATQTIANNITGTGTMEIGGTNTTIALTGSNAPTSGAGVVTTIDSGNTLKAAAASVPGNVVNNGTLDFTQAADGIYANSITSGTGSVIKDGVGTLTLSGTNTYAGTTTINAGRVDVTATTTSTGGFTVEAAQTGSSTITGGTLGGTGTVSGNIVNNGTVSPGTAGTGGTPIAILTQTAGNYTGNSGSTFVVNVNGTGTPTPGSTNSELSTTGSATLNSGSNVLVNVTGSNFMNGGVYTAIAGGSAATVSPGATISTNESFIRATDLMASGDDVVFTLTTNFLPTSGATFNQIQLGRYLNANSTNTNPDFVLVQNALTSITNQAEARAALTQITGDIHPTLAQVNLNNTQIVIQQVATRLRGGNFAPCGPLAVAQDGNPAAAPIAFVGCDENGMPEFDGGEQCAQPQSSAWGIGFGMGGSTEFSGNATSASFGMGGVVAGMEHWEDDSHLLGLYGAYVGSGVDTPNGQSATMNGGQFGAYMFGDDGFNYYTVLGGFEFDGDTTTRRLGFGTGTDALTDINNSSYSDWQSFVYAERGMSFQSGQHVIQPFVGLQYIFVRQDAFTETGGTNTALDLAGSADTTNSLRSMLGTRMQWAFTNHGGRRTLPEIHAMWVHEFLDTSSGLTETMVPIGGTPFIVQGLDSGRDWAVVGGNFTWEMVNNWSMFVNYDLQTNANTTYHVGSGGLGYRW
jgi:autotransporter-associated beta strand protein